MIRAGSHARLFCFPHAGGGPAAFDSWRKSAPLGVDVCPAQPPGRGPRRREQLFERVEHYARAALAALGGALDRPYALFGHSVGAFVAYELARQAVRAGARPPSALLVAAARAPHLAPRRPPVATLTNVALVASLRELGGVPDAVLASDELMAMALPVLRAEMALDEEYRVDGRGVPLDCPVHAFAGTSDPFAAPDEVAQWERYTRGGFRCDVVPGGHFFLERPELIDAAFAAVSAARRR